MTLFDLPQAKHFCRPLRQPAPGAGQSLASLHAKTSTVTQLRERSRGFDAHRISLLNSVERWLLYSLGHYRRSLDMIVPVSAPWLHVTLYYASFFAANAILGMFGGWIGTAPSGNRVVDVEDGTPDSQVLRIRRRVESPHGSRGSHRFFWDFFYEAAATVSMWAPPQLRSALVPVNGDFTWQTTQRNEVNYDTLRAWEASTLLHSTFTPDRFPESLDGPLGQQFETTEQMVRLATVLAKMLAVQSFALDGCGANGTRLQIQEYLVGQMPPATATKSALRELWE